MENFDIKEVQKFLDGFDKFCSLNKANCDECPFSDINCPKVSTEKFKEFTATVHDWIAASPEISANTVTTSQYHDILQDLQSDGYHWIAKDWLGRIEIYASKPYKKNGDWYCSDDDHVDIYVDAWYTPTDIRFIESLCHSTDTEPFSIDDYLAKCQIID